MERSTKADYVITAMVGKQVLLDSARSGRSSREFQGCNLCGFPPGAPAFARGLRTRASARQAITARERLWLAETT